MAALYFYVLYTEKKKIWMFVAILCLYAFGLMSKPIILIFPFLLLVLDYWPLQRFQGWDPGSSVRLSDFQHPVQKFIALCKSHNGIIVWKVAVRNSVIAVIIHIDAVCVEI